MKNNLLLLLCLLSGTTLFAQTQAIVRISDVIVDPSIETIACVQISADSFPDIAAMEFALKWDASLLTFNSVDFGDNPLGISNGQTNLLNDSTFILAWTDAQLQGNTLNYQQQFMEVCFIFEPNTEGVSPVGFDPDRNLLFVQEGSISPYPSMTFDGSITLAIDVSAVNIPAWAQEVTLFPNPTADDFIQLQGNFPALDGIALFDLNGRMLRAYAPAQTRLPLNELPAGQYVLRLQSGADQANFRLIKQ